MLQLGINLEEVCREMKNRKYSIFERTYSFLKWNMYEKVLSFPYEIKYFYQRGVRGYSDRDVWNFNDYLAKIISEGCSKMSKQCYGYPSGMSTEKWKSILTEISTGFKEDSNDDDLFMVDVDKYEEKKFTKI